MFVYTMFSFALEFPSLSTAFINIPTPESELTVTLSDFLLVTFVKGVLEFQVAPLVTFWYLNSYQEISKSRNRSPS